MSTSLRRAGAEDVDALIPLVRAYHAFEGIDADAHALSGVLIPLLQNDDIGRIFFIVAGEKTVGYVALCFGYSIEFGGRDAFIDELFVNESDRGRGIGRAAMTALLAIAKDLEIKALHLEVQPGNEVAHGLYASFGFEPRERYGLMTRR